MPAAYSYDESSLTLRVGEGEFGPVAPQVWRYEVSGMRVVAKWLGYRMREPAGKRASPLNAIVARTWRPQWSTELLSLLWVLERLTRLEPEQAALLKDIADAPLVTAGELEAAGILGKATKLPGSRKRPRKRGQDTSLLE